MVSLADVGLAQRVFDNYRRDQESDEFTKSQRAFTNEQQGWQREDRPIQQQEQRQRITLNDLNAANAKRQGQQSQLQLDAAQREEERRQAAGKTLQTSDKGIAGSWLDIADQRKQAGDIEGYTKYSELYRKAKAEGIGEVAHAAMSGASPQELVDINNRYGEARVSRFDVKDITDNAGNVVDRQITAVMADGTTHPPVSARNVLVGIGALKPDEYEIKDGYKLNKRTGQTSQLDPSYKPKDYLFELKRPDGSTYLVDGRDMNKVKDAQSAAAADAGLTDHQATRLWKSLLSGKGEFDSLAPDAQKKVWDGYLNGLKLLKQNPNMDPGEAGIHGYRLATGEMTPDQVPGGAAPAPAAPAGGGNALPPVPAGAPAGAKYVTNPKTNQPVLVIEKDGKFYPVIARTPAAAPAGPSAPTPAPAVQPAPVVPAPSAATPPEPTPRVPIVGAANDSAASVGRVLGGGAAAPAPTDEGALAMPNRVQLEQLRRAGSTEPPVSIAPGGMRPIDLPVPGTIQTAPAGNTAPIDKSRPILKNGDGSFSTERTITIEADGRYFVIPTIVDGKARTPEEATRLFKNGQNDAVGQFESQEAADAYATQRSNLIGAERGQEAGVTSAAPAAKPAVKPASLETVDRNRVPAKSAKQLRNEAKDIGAKLTDLEKQLDAAKKANKTGDVKRLETQRQKLNKRFDDIETELDSKK